MFDFRSNFNVYAGCGAISSVKNILNDLGCSHPIIICDKGVMELGLINMLTAPLEENGITYDIYSGVVPEPTHARVEEAVEAAKKAGADVILALGGGATIDTAKGVSVLFNNDCILWEVGGQGLNPCLPIIAVPTTSGTGSDQSFGGMISDEMHIKHGIYSEKPVATICDADFTKDLPKGPTVNGAVDAFCHAFEAYTCSMANPYTDLFAEKAMESVYINLPRVLKDPHDMTAREQLMITASYCGMLIAQVGTQAGHAIGHAVGGRLNVVHGQAVAVTLPQMMYLYADTLPDKMRYIGKMIEADIPEEISDEQLGSVLKTRMVDLLKEWGINNLKESGVNEEELLKLSETIMADGFFYSGERDIEEEELEDILKSSYCF